MAYGCMGGERGPCLPGVAMKGSSFASDSLRESWRGFGLQKEHDHELMNPPGKGCIGNQLENATETKQNVTETTPQNLETIRRCNGNWADLRRKPKRDVTETTENQTRNPRP